MCLRIFHTRIFLHAALILNLSTIWPCAAFCFPALNVFFSRSKRYFNLYYKLTLYSFLYFFVALVIQKRQIRRAWKKLQQSWWRSTMEMKTIIFGTIVESGGAMWRFTRLMRHQSGCVFLSRRRTSRKRVNAEIESLRRSLRYTTLQRKSFKCFLIK